MSACTKVSLRQKHISHGRISLYLDYYPAIRNPHTMKMTRREFLGIYILKDATDPKLREYNEEMLQKAEAIRCLRQMSLINEEFGFMDKYKMAEDALAYFEKIAKKKGDKYEFTYVHFKNFTQGTCTFGDLTVDLCNKFCKYLQNQRQLRHPEQKICHNTAAAYWCTFRSMLKMAYLDKYLKENLNDHLDRLNKDEVKRNFLTQDELKRLANTECKHEVLKRASLFSCLTGLRISDIENLTWDKIVIGPDNGYCIDLKTQKTDTLDLMPISDEAVELCGERGEGKVFKGLKRCMIQVPLKQWLQKAGITKPMSFHCFRHTYATLQVAKGTDIYVLMKMMTHKNVSTTQIYADMVNEKKREVVDRISLK